MKRLIAATIWLVLASTAAAHKQTERYIPIGESPGVSGRSSVVGPITEVDHSAGTFQLRTQRGIRGVAVGAQTPVWLDRSDARRSNGSGSFADCEVGHTVEVYLAPDGQAHWIKVRAR